jgi:hypothetical protein
VDESVDAPVKALNDGRSVKNAVDFAAGLLRRGGMVRVLTDCSAINRSLD